VTTERILSKEQTAEMGHLRWVLGVTLPDNWHRSEIRKARGDKLLLLIERSQFCWFNHVPRMPQERLTKQVLLLAPTGKRPRGCPRTRWPDYISDLTWSPLRVDPGKDSWGIFGPPKIAAPATLPKGRVDTKM